MNRFEAMLAPPTLSNKDMSMHAKMQTAVPRDEARNYISEMLVPEVRLYDELTTLRFRRPGPDEDNPAYRRLCRALSGASGTPIPYRFFKTEFDRLMQDLGIPEGSRTDAGSIKTDKVKRAVDALKDPWRIQAYAALCARIAEASETEDAKNAAKAWDKAFTLYSSFFNKTKVEESSTYKLQTEEKFRQETVSAWNGFLKELSDGIVSRIKGYIRDGKPESVAACIDALGSGSVSAVDKSAVDRALEDTLVPYVNALNSANSLKEAGQLYDKIPPLLKEKDTRQECLRAMLSCMSKEVDRLLKSGKSVSTVISWMDKLGVDNLRRTGSPLVKKAADDFYSSCAVYICEVINGHKYDLAVFADKLAAKLPDDVEIAKDNDGNSLCRKDVIGICTRDMISSKYESRIKNVSSESSASSLGRDIYNVINSVSLSGNARKEFLGTVMKDVIVMIVNNKMDPRYQLKFLDCYEDSMPVDFSDFKDSDVSDIKTVGDYKRKLFEVPEHLQALKDFAEADNGTYEQLSALRRVINCALQDPDREINDEKYIQLTERLCSNAFIGCLNEKDSVSDYRFESDYKPVMSLAASFLPSDYVFPSGGKQKITVDALELLLGLDIDHNLRNRADKARKEAGIGRNNGGNKRNEKPKVGIGTAFGAAIILALVPGILFAILSVILHVRGSLPTALLYIRMLLQISIVSCFVAGFAGAWAVNEETRTKFSYFIMQEAFLLYTPVAYLMSLRFFNVTTWKLWTIIVFIVIIIFCLIKTVTLLRLDD